MLCRVVNYMHGSYPDGNDKEKAPQRLRVRKVIVSGMQIKVWINLGLCHLEAKNIGANLYINSA